ncbi:unnamed protein product [Notodromas monacha]|uniref:Insulin-like domain-containing protein n=1 Tax=Notodromas monacha TaxID=399045 RepID=A0A7R9BGL1_9CRUS|nr:unnamed protein product [Notodromas monacha]CAG0915106.1 unnamed protein product [Notodromas monacha]
MGFELVLGQGAQKPSIDTGDLQGTKKPRRFTELVSMLETQRDCNSVPAVKSARNKRMSHLSSKAVLLNVCIMVLPIAHAAVPGLAFAAPQVHSNQISFAAAEKYGIMSDADSPTYRRFSSKPVDRRVRKVSLTDTVVACGDFLLLTLNFVCEMFERKSDRVKRRAAARDNFAEVEGESLDTMSLLLNKRSQNLVTTCCYRECRVSQMLDYCHHVK